MDKHILEQYADLIKEQEDLKKRIKHTENQIVRLRSEQVAYSVTLGRHGKKPLGRITIHGTPHPEIEKKRRRLRRDKRRMVESDEKISEMISDVQRYIDEIDDSRIRRIFRYRYIDRLSWIQVAFKMGGRHTAESCRNAAERYLGKRK